ncbi:CBASS cGAMP-activated phospholipase [Flectobacillus roseus]|uniref:CBASS cGAMP-activated phospholipase n=1 Tax=Flectobacillus roseus TaxID=502259 RepID=A0ABT6Y6Z2_9BACT|nr:CBASS cGAMP-activated phospholipase [Flectobacillus roseus]MDI9859340.1 CBASS cGAMP-activated phospholipase [Flectobacillus roseus]
MQMKDEFKILCIDGGGIRGIIPSKFLSKLEDHISKQKGEETKLNEYFDLICGTSTGGIIAIGLGLGMTAKDIHKLYEENAIKIFGSPKTGFLRLIKQFFFPKHTRKNLNTILKNSFSIYSEDGDTRLGHSKTRLCIPAFNASTGNTVVFKTSHHKDYTRDYHIPAYQVALATSAAPTYFTPYEINYQQKKSTEKVNFMNMVDGGIFANNPSLIGLTEALALGYSFNQIKILSIGTGSTTITYPKQRKAFSSGARSWIDPFKGVPLIEVMMQSQSSITENIMKVLSQGVHHDNTERFVYHRFQDKFNHTDKIALDDTTSDKIKLMNSKGRSLFENANKELINHFFETKITPYQPFNNI